MSVSSGIEKMTTSSLAARVVARYAGVVVPLRPKPGVHLETIAGRKYVLSTDGGPLGDHAEAPEWAGDARIVDLGRPENKWRFLWVYDLDRKQVAMWRVTDGNNKEWGADSHYTTKIVQLDRKGQLNRVSRTEFDAIEREMIRREDAHIRNIEESIEESKSEYQRQIDKYALEYFERIVAPKIQRAVNGVMAGAIPLGFEPEGPGVDDERARTRQMCAYVVGQILKHELSEDKVASYIRHHGVDPYDPNEDSQAVYWALGDLRDEAYKRFLPER
jgi:hypothetical protein